MNQKTDPGEGAKKPKPLSEKSQVTIRTTLITVVGSVLVAGFTTIGTIYVTKSTVAQAKKGAIEAKTSVDKLKDQVADAQGSMAVPAGTIIAYGGLISNERAERALKSKGWLPCDGRPVSRTEYSNLWKVINVSWGEGDRGTTFNLPDLRGVFLRGVNGGQTNQYCDPDADRRTSLAPGGSAGNSVGSYQSDNLQTHSHQWSEAGPDKKGVSLYSWNDKLQPVKALYRGANGQIARGGSAIDDDYMDVIDDKGGFWTTNGPCIRDPKTETRPRNACVNYLIKY